VHRRATSSVLVLAMRCSGLLTAVKRRVVHTRMHTHSLIHFSCVHSPSPSFLPVCVQHHLACVEQQACVVSSACCRMNASKASAACMAQPQGCGVLLVCRFPMSHNDTCFSQSDKESEGPLLTCAGGRGRACTGGSKCAAQCGMHRLVQSRCLLAFHCSAQRIV
jgi:hypothetical protein